MYISFSAGEKPPVEFFVAVDSLLFLYSQLRWPRLPPWTALPKLAVLPGHTASARYLESYGAMPVYKSVCTHTHIYIHNVLFRFFRHVIWTYLFACIYIYIYMYMCVCVCIYI